MFIKNTYLVFNQFTRLLTLKKNHKIKISKSKTKAYHSKSQQNRLIRSGFLFDQTIDTPNGTRQLIN